jgi:uncharacterized membrane protein
MFVHFPIALWLSALLFWGLALFRAREDLWAAGRWLLYLGLVGALAAVGTGLWAADQMGHDAPGHDLVHTHRNWMLLTSAVGLVTTAAAFLTRGRATPRVRWLLFGMLLVTGGLTTLGADRGALLVFRYGVGTQVERPRSDPLQGHEDAGRPPEGDSHAEHRH